MGKVCVLGELSSWGIGAQEFIIYLSREGIYIKDSTWICYYGGEVEYGDLEYVKSTFTGRQDLPNRRAGEKRRPYKLSPSRRKNDNRVSKTNEPDDKFATCYRVGIVMLTMPYKGC